MIGNYKLQMEKILHKQNKNLIEYILLNIATDYNLDINELKTKYLDPVVKFNKRNTKKAGKKNCYSMFICDETVKKYIEENIGKDLTFKQKTKEYAKIWKAMSKTDKDKYRLLAKEYNEKQSETSSSTQ